MLSCKELPLKASDYLEGDPPLRTRIGMRLHIALCQHCRRYLRQLRLVAGVLALSAHSKDEGCVEEDRNLRKTSTRSKPRVSLTAFSATSALADRFKCAAAEQAATVAGSKGENMSKWILLVITLLLSFSANAADNGILSKPSSYSVPETLDRLETVVRAKGLSVFARIDHSGEAEKVGLKMRPTQLLIFGNPKTGTPLMNSSPSIAIDLPLKALAWEDSNAKVWLSYNSADYLKQRHDLKEEFVKGISAVGVLIDEAVK